MEAAARRNRFGSILERMVGNLGISAGGTCTEMADQLRAESKKAYENRSFVKMGTQPSIRYAIARWPYPPAFPSGTRQYVA